MGHSIVLTGGGTAGHVTPNLALLPALKEAGFDVTYIGSLDGIEKNLAEDAGLDYYGIAVGKLRRYFDPKNFSDPFRVIKGFFQARKILKTVRPEVVFSKGGFVAVPVVRAAASLKIPCIIHESDITPGLANKLCIPVADIVCCNFPETFDLIPPKKAHLTGSPIRAELFKGDREAGKKFVGFTDDKPVIMVIGGSQGSAAINGAIRDSLNDLLKDFNIVHLTGKDKTDNMLLTVEGYKQFEYITDELPDIFALADIVVSRSGANAIGELLALHKPNLLIPLPSASSRGDQIMNARSYEDQGFSMVLNEEDMTSKLLISKIRELYENKDKYIEAMSESKQRDAISAIMDLIMSVIKH
ncbi:UDP-N-acetylglucosamine-N-acetylmuramylpentapeptide N-acetylglucosamine transferase [Lachnospiraceae bacterium XBB2008]|nr:UDP-N-acetylglucosamine-N-acetylmuramylpentapeptide N-acetylglucosamine transferase [Lachnospiraceae bacterium XBB2008]